MKKGVMRPGHIQIRVLDMDEALKHYRDVMGLIEVDRQGDKAFLKAWTEVDSYSIILRETDEAGMDFMGFKVVDEATLDSLRQDLINYGLEVTDKPAGDLPGCGRRVEFTLPTGHHIELYATKEQPGKWGVSNRNPEAWPLKLSGMRISRFDHALLYGDDIDGVLDIFENVLGFKLAEEAVEPDGNKIAIFMTCSMKEHDIAFIRQPMKDKFHHVSFILESWDDVLKAADIISMTDTPIDIGPTRHGLTHGETIYFFDPSGNRNEVFCGGSYTYPDHPVITWDAEQLGKAVFYHARELNERFLTVVT